MIRMTKPVIAGLLCAATIAACKKGNDTYANGNVDTTGAKPVDTTTAAAATPTNSPTAPGKWTNAVVVGYAWAANDGEIALSKLATTKATNAEVKAFAKEMVTDHTKTSSELKGLVGDGKVQAVLPTALDSSHQSKLDKLKNATGNDFSS